MLLHRAASGAHAPVGAVAEVPGLGQLSEDDLLAMLDHDQGFEMDEEEDEEDFLDEFDEAAAGAELPPPTSTTTTTTTSATEAPTSKRSDPLAARLGLSTGDKAGMQSVDKEKANKIIYDMSKVRPLHIKFFNLVIISLLNIEKF
jgi:hypothetical protein